jgi:heptosyltransferase-3
MAATNLLIIHQGALGDFVAIFAVILRLRRYFDRIDVLCQSRLGKLAAALGLVDKWFALEASCFASLYADSSDQRIADLLKPYSKIVLFSFSQQLEQSLNRITANRCLRIAPRPPVTEGIHVLEFALKNLIGAGLIKETDRHADMGFRPHIANQNPKPLQERRKILIHPGAGSIRKRWPLSRFIQIERRLRTDGLNPEFILGPAEIDLAEALSDLDDPPAQVHILEEMPDLPALLKTAGGYLGNDSGVSHLAAFLGLATVVIFGPTDPQRWKPIGPAVESVRPDLECRPCFEIEPANCLEAKCLNATSPETVIRSFYRIYEHDEIAKSIL